MVSTSQISKYPFSYELICIFKFIVLRASVVAMAVDVGDNPRKVTEFLIQISRIKKLRTDQIYLAIIHHKHDHKLIQT